MATTNNITVTGSSLTTSGTTPVVTAQSQQPNIATGLAQPVIQTTGFDESINVQITGLGGGAAPDTSTNVGLNGETVVYTLFFNYPRLSILQKATTADAIQSFRVGKTLKHDATTQEQLQKYLGVTILPDTARHTDVPAKEVKKQLAHTFLKSDKVELTLNKAVEDPVLKSDQTKISVNKVLKHDATTSEQFARTVAYNRIFTDTVDATDDFFGEANIDDDQTARVNKVVVDSATSTDVKTAAISKVVEPDTASTQDQKTLLVNKGIAINAIHADQASLANTKILADTSTTLDTARKNTGKTLAHNFTRTEEVRNRVQKGAVDTAVSTEQKRVEVSKVLRDTVTKQDTVTTVWSVIRDFTENKNTQDLARFAIRPVKFDQSTATDTPYITVNKAFVETKIASDTVSTQVDYNRSFFDVIDATDDFFGNANVDDDQVARVGKVVAEYATTYDPIQFSAAKIFQDTAQVQDTPDITTTKVFLDTFAKSDQVRLASEKALLEAKFISDVNNKRLGKNFVEIVASTEVVGKLINKVPNRYPADGDFALADDGMTYIYVAKNILDSNAATDTKYLELSKIFSESNTILDTSAITTTKAVREIVVKSDVNYIDISKPVIDTVLQIDITSVELTKPFYETVVKSDYQTANIGKIVEDTVTMSDLIIVSSLLRKTLEDSVDATDDFFGTANLDDDQVARVGKYVTDYANTVEALEFSSVKSVIDITSLQNPIAIQTTKPFTDSFVKSDVNYIEISKVSLENVSTTDNAYRDISKVAVDAAISTDSRTIVLDKTAADITVVLDTAPVFIIGNNLTDTATTIDNKTLVIGKGVTESSVSTDTLSFSAAKEVLDNILIDNPVSLQPTKVFSELNTATDSNFFNTNKITEDIASNLETISKDTAKPFTDTATNTDSTPKTISVPKYDTTNVAEVIQLVSSFNRDFTDFVDATDDFFGNANVDDDQIARIGKNPVNYATTVDVKQVAIAAVKADIATSMDTPYKRTGKSATTDTAIASDVFAFQKITNRALTEVRNVSDTVYINWQDYCEPDILDVRYVGQEQFFSYN
jgi:hypothetical protein